MNVHAACVFFCRHYVPVAGETYEQTCDRHVGYLRAYGEFIESNGLPDKLLKFNLHMVCCRLKAQCMARGHVGAENELFIERAILAIKYYIRGKINQWPEKVMINGLLRKLAIDGF